MKRIWIGGVLLLSSVALPVGAELVLLDSPQGAIVPFVDKSIGAAGHVNGANMASVAGTHLVFFQMNTAVLGRMSLEGQIVRKQLGNLCKSPRSDR